MVYAGISDRIKALFFDAFFIGILFFVAASFLDSREHVTPNLRFLVFIFVFYLYEPICVTIFGGSIGHLLNNLRIRKESDETKKINLFQALLRFGVKLLLGFISFFTMRSDDKSRAMHDMASGSVVVFHKKK